MGKGKRKKNFKKDGITFRLVHRDKDPNSHQRFWWEPENVRSDEDYEKMLGFVGKQNLDLLPEEWRPEDYEEPEHDLNIQNICGDLLGDGKYDQFVVEEISDEEEDLEDKIQIEENVDAPKEIVRGDGSTLFIEPGYENHDSIFAHDKLTAREMDYVLNKITNEGVQKLAEDDDELKEIMEALENPEEFEEANEEWLLGFDEDEDDQGFWGGNEQAETWIPPPAEFTPEFGNIIAPPIVSDKPVENPESEIPKLSEPEENQASNYDILAEEEDIDEAHFDKMLEEFDDEKIGELDDEEVDAEGGMEVNAYAWMYDDFIEKKSKDWGKPPETAVQDVIRSYVENYVEETEEETKIEIDKLSFRPERDRWDCESVITTYSNLENHPRTLKLRKVTTKKQMIEIRRGMAVIPESPDDEDAGVVYDEEEEKESEEGQVSLVEVSHKRDRNESREAKKRRKQLVKEQRRLARQQKKALKSAFKDARKKHKKQDTALKMSHNTATKI